VPAPNAWSSALTLLLDRSREAYRRVISDLEHAGADGIIYGCTEIDWSAHHSAMRRHRSGWSSGRRAPGAARARAGQAARGGW
jgi:hypothetical protein